jgi:hypothetical protein
MTRITQLEDRGAAVAWSPVASHADFLALGAKVCSCTESVVCCRRGYILYIYGICTMYTHAGIGDLIQYDGTTRATRDCRSMSYAHHSRTAERRMFDMHLHLVQACLNLQFPIRRSRKICRILRGLALRTLVENWSYAIST